MSTRQLRRTRARASGPGSSALAAAPEASLAGLPFELWDVIGGHLFGATDSLNNTASKAHDVAALAQSSK